MFKNNSKNDTINNTQMENEQNDAKHDMNSLFERLFSEIEDLKNSNKEILDKVKILKEENAGLKNMVKNLNKFKNFNYYDQNQLNSLNNYVDVEKEMNDDDCVVFSPKADNISTCQSNKGNSHDTFKEPRRVKPSYLYPNGSVPEKDQQKVYNFRMSNKPKSVVGTYKETTSNGLFGASKLFEYYGGFWRKDSSLEKVKEHIGKFANVEKIESLNTDNKK
jgi:hypothetical protein